MSYAMFTQQEIDDAEPFIVSLLQSKGVPIDLEGNPTGGNVISRRVIGEYPMYKHVYRWGSPEFMAQSGNQSIVG